MALLGRPNVRGGVQCCSARHRRVAKKGVGRSSRSTLPRRRELTSLRMSGLTFMRDRLSASPVVRRSCRRVPPLLRALRLLSAWPVLDISWRVPPRVNVGLIRRRCRPSVRPRVRVLVWPLRLRFLRNLRSSRWVPMRSVACLWCLAVCARPWPTSLRVVLLRRWGSV